MYVYIDTIKVINAILLIGEDKFYEIKKDVTKKDVTDVLLGNLDASLLTYLKVAESINVNLNELVFYCYDKARSVTVNGLLDLDQEFIVKDEGEEEKNSVYKGVIKKS